MMIYGYKTNDPKEQADRVQFAVNVILRGGNTTRNFDNCFENDDADMVAAKIYRRALKNPALMKAIPRYLVVDQLKECYERLILKIEPPRSPDA